MTLHGYSLHDVAKAVEATPHAVAYWLNGSHVPAKTKMARIIELTKGHVDPNSFFEIPPKRSAAE